MAVIRRNRLDGTVHNQRPPAVILGDENMRNGLAGIPWEFVHESSREEWPMANVALVDRGMASRPWCFKADGRTRSVTPFAQTCSSLWSKRERTAPSAGSSLPGGMGSSRQAAIYARPTRKALPACPGNSFEAALRAAFSFPKPMIAAVNGHAIAGGLVLALAADHCVLADGAYKLGLTELDIGLPLPRVAFEILRFALPPQALARLAYGADLLGPPEAHAIGVAQELVPPADLERSARAWLSPIAARPLAPFALCKSWLRSDALARIDGQTEAERQAINDAASTTETRARLAAYAKRLRH